MILKATQNNDISTIFSSGFLIFYKMKLCIKNNFFSSGSKSILIESTTVYELNTSTIFCKNHFFLKKN